MNYPCRDCGKAGIVAIEDYYLCLKHWHLEIEKMEARIKEMANEGENSNIPRAEV